MDGEQGRGGINSEVPVMIVWMWAKFDDGIDLFLPLHLHRHFAIRP